MNIKSFLGLVDVIVPSSDKLHTFLEQFDPNSCVWVFDFDGNLIHKGFNSFSPIDTADKDHDGVLSKMKEYMVCIEEATNYENLYEILKKENISLPHDVAKLTGSLSFSQFKDSQMDYWRLFTMERAVERKLPMKEFDLSNLRFRSGAVKLIQTLLEKQYPTLIITSGVGNLVRCAMEHAGFDLAHPFLHIKGNDFLLDNDGRVAGFDPDLITPFTKKHIDYHRYGIGDMSYAIQSGDGIGDAQMIVDHFSPEEIISIGFTNGKEHKKQSFPGIFDIVFTDIDSGFDSIHKLFLG